MYHAGPAREALTLFYLLVMLYGTLRLSYRRDAQYENDPVSAVLARADQALYRGKAAGRNRIV